MNLKLFDISQALLIIVEKSSCKLVMQHFLISDFVFASGCEFFRDFKDNEYNADGLYFNWQQVKNININEIWN